jgi:hypothetical protein
LSSPTTVLAAFISTRLNPSWNTLGLPPSNPSCPRPCNPTRPFSTHRLKHRTVPIPCSMRST